MSIVVENLVKQYGATPAVRGVSWQIAPGQVVGLIGPNGAGKSSLLRMLSTFLPPTSGVARVAGFDCETEALEVRRRLGYLPETLPECPEARVVEYLQFRAQLKGIPRRERSLEIDRCLDCLQIRDVGRRLLGRLSQGYRRRVGLAEILLGDPRVLILDEPTLGLDPLQVRELRQLLLRLAETRTVLLSTHLLAEAESLCGRVLMLSGGRLVSDVRMDDLRSRGESLEGHFVRVADDARRAA